MQPRNRRHVGAFPVVTLCLALSMIQAESPDPNVLETRSRVAEMADESIEMLQGQVAIEGVKGWAVFSGDRLPPGLELGPGVGMAEDFLGETWFLRTQGRECTAPNHRHVLVFRDEDLFRDFRQGEVPGATLERLRSHSPPGRVLAFTFRPADQPRLEPMGLSGCRFALHKDLQRALVAEPSRTEDMIEEDEVYEDDN